MLTQLLIFVAALAALLYAARVFTGAAEKLGAWLGMSPFVVGVFIVGVGTSLPELISSILAVRQSVSEIVPGNVMGASISNLLLITGVVAWLNRRDIVLAKSYIFIDLHYLIGALMLFAVVAYDGIIRWQEAWVGIVAFVVYSLYLLSDAEGSEGESASARGPFPMRAVLMLLAAGVGIYFGADYTVSSISAIAAGLGIPPSVIALTVLSLGTTLPELAVNVSAIRQGKAEMAVGNVLGSCIFNLMVVPGAAAMFGAVAVPAALLVFSLPFLLGSGLFFYLLTQDKTLSRWEGLLFILIYALFLLKAAGVA
jgi:cation:H+ antiporter